MIRLMIRSLTAMIFMFAGTAMATVFEHTCTCDPGDRGDVTVRNILIQREATVAIADIVRIKDVRLDEAGTQFEVDWQWQGVDYEAVGSRRLYLAGPGSGDPGTGPSGGPTGGPGQWGTGGTWDCGTATGGGSSSTNCTFVPLMNP